MAGRMGCCPTIICPPDGPIICPLDCPPTICPLDEPPIIGCDCIVLLPGLGGGFVQLDCITALALCSLGSPQADVPSSTCGCLREVGGDGSSQPVALMSVGTSRGVFQPLPVIWLGVLGVVGVVAVLPHDPADGVLTELLALDQEFFPVSTVLVGVLVG